MPGPGFHQQKGGGQKHKNFHLKDGWYRLEVTDAVRRRIGPSPAREQHIRAQGAGDGKEEIVSKILHLFSVAVSFQNTPFF